MKFDLKIFLISLALISPIISIIDEETVEDLEKNKAIDFEINKEKRYKIEIDKEIKEEYVYFEIKGTNVDNNYVLSIVEDFEKESRIQLAQSRLGKTKLILSLKQIKDNSINIILECSDYNNCSGTIENKFYGIIPLKENEPIYYYNTIDNMIMKFSIQSSSDIINIWARGELEIEKKLEGIEIYKESENMIYLMDKIDNGVNLTVTGKKGDYINVGFVGYNKNVEKNNKYFLSTNLVSNGDIITTYLNKEDFEEACYNYDKSIYESILGYGVIFKNKLTVHYYENENENNKEDYLRGSFELFNINNNDYICFKLNSNNINETIYSFQLFSSNISYKLNILEPNHNGLFYTFDISYSSNIPLVSYNTPNSNIVTYYLLSPFKNINLVIYNCDNYPLCSFDEHNLDKNNTIQKIGNENTLSFKKDEKYDFTPISKYQKLFVAENNDKKEDGLFMALISRDDTEIIISKESLLNRYTIKGQIDKYKIEETIDDDILELVIEVNILVGDVDLYTNFTNSNIEFNKNQYINKIILMIKANNLQKSDRGLKFYIQSFENSYYSLSYYKISKDIQKSYLRYYTDFGGVKKLLTVSLNDSYTDIDSDIILMKFNTNSNLITSFYSPNCNIEIFRIRENNDKYKVEKYGKFFNEIIYPFNLSKPMINYKINIMNEDLSEYDNKKCEIYVSNFEGVNDLLLVDNLIEHVMFNKDNKHFSYGYVQVNRKNDILIKFSPKNKAKYLVKIYYLNQKKDTDSIILSDDIIYLNYEEWEDICIEESIPCYIKIDITLEEVNFEENPEPRLEFSVKSLHDKMLSYLPKNDIIKDYVHYQQSQYYYTELGKDEIGFVQINFLKGSGKVVGKIIDKKDSNWRDNLPTENNSDLKMDLITKKIKFSTEGLNCENKCYLILNVYSDIIADTIQMKRLYPYSILIHSYPKNIQSMKLPLISAPIDEYIMGSLEKGKQEEIYEYYNIILNDDSEKIIIDFQSQNSGILINIGEIIPDIENASFNFSAKEQNNIFIINKKEMGVTSLKGLNITLAIYSNEKDSPDIIPYSFIVRLSNEDTNTIYKINSEHKTLCNPKQLQNDKYQCLYIIEYDYLSDFNSIILYPKSQIQTDFIIQAKYINAEDYIFNNISDLINYNFTNKEYLFIKEGFMEKNKFILISIVTSKETKIELMTLFYTYNTGISLYSFSQNLLYIQKKEQFKIIAPKDKKGIINVNILEGNGELYLKSNDKNKYYLQGIDDNLMITLDKNEEMIINEINDGDLIMYIEYNIKNIDIENFDEIKLDKSSKFCYYDTNFPIRYYTYIDISALKDDDYYEINFNFNQLKRDNSNKEIYNFEFYAYLTDHENIFELYDLLADNNNITQNISGKYDPALKMGIIRISKKDIDKYHLTNDNNYLILNINSKNNEKYENIEIEISSIKKDSNKNIKNNIYYLGLLSSNEKEKKYKLKTDFSYKYLNLQFNFDNEKLSPEIEGKSSFTFEGNKYGNYYYSYKLENDDYLNLIIKRKKNNDNNDEYFMFKYSCSNDTINNKYKISDTSLVVSESKSSNNSKNVTINLKPVDNYNLYDINYIINILSKEKMSKSEIYPNFEKMPNIELYNPELDKQTKKVIFKIEKIDDSANKCVQVFVKINNKDEIEFLSYDLLNDLNKIETEGDKNNNNTLIIILSVVGGLIIIAILILIIYIYHSKKGLKTNISKISFQQERESNLLLKDDN